MGSTKKEREEMMLRIIDLARSVRERKVDPFEVEVWKLFDRLHELLPKIRDPRELYLDILAVLGLSDVVYLRESGSNIGLRFFISTLSSSSGSCGRSPRRNWRGLC